MACGVERNRETSAFAGWRSDLLNAKFVDMHDRQIGGLFTLRSGLV